MSTDTGESSYSSTGTSDERRTEYLNSLRDKSLKEMTFVNRTSEGYLDEEIQKLNKRQRTNSNGKKPDRFDPSKVVESDGVFVDDEDVSVGTTIKQAAVEKLHDYEQLNSAEKALVNLGMNSILDLTQGYFTGQKNLFGIAGWNELKNQFSKKWSVSPVSEITKNELKMICYAWRTKTAKDGYWTAKDYQRHATNLDDEISFEITALVLDQYVKQHPILHDCRPKPTEMDLLIKVWGPIFETLFYKSNLTCKWDSMQPTSMFFANENGERVVVPGFRVDLRVVFMWNQTEVDVAVGEVAAGCSDVRKVKADRSKILKEAKALYDSIIDEGLLAGEDEDNLMITSLQIVGLEATFLETRSISDGLYLSSTASDIQYPFKGNTKQVESFVSTLLEFRKKCAAIHELQKDILSQQRRTSQSHQRHFKNRTPKVISSKQSHLRNSWHFDNDGYSLPQNFTKQ